MSINNATRVLPETLRTVLFGAISGTYAALGTPLEHSAHAIILQNLTDTTMVFSWNGTNDHQVLAAGTSLVLDVTANKTSSAGAFYIAKSTQFWVKQLTAPSSGSVYLTALYGRSV